jgi:hypothetical protein
MSASQPSNELSSIYIPTETASIRLMELNLQVRVFLKNKSVFM